MERTNEARSTLSSRNLGAICAAFTFAAVATGCNSPSQPVNVFLEADGATGNMNVSIENRTDREFSLSPRLFDMLGNGEGGISIAVKTVDGKPVAMCRGLNYSGSEDLLNIPQDQAVSIPFHVSAIIQTHCLKDSDSYSVSVLIGPMDEIGLGRTISSNEVELHSPARYLGGRQKREAEKFVEPPKN